LAKITILIPCYNELGNVSIIYEKLIKIIHQYDKEKYEFIILFIDNDSNDGTQTEIRDIAEKDDKVKAIFNLRNFGWIRPQWYGLIHAPGDAVIQLACDMQEPPELIPNFLENWSNGELIVAGVKTESEENKILYYFRTTYYKIIDFLSEESRISHFTGFGLYDRKIIEQLKNIEDMYPYTRGIFQELGYKPKIIEYRQRKRIAGESKFNL